MTATTVTDNPKLDYDRFIGAIETIVMSPRNWDQGNWGIRNECGTSHCFAGFAAQHEELTDPNFEILWRHEPGDPSHVVSCEKVQLPSGERAEIDDWAASALGLTGIEASRLFYGVSNNNLWDLFSACNHILRDHGRPPLPRPLDFAHELVSRVYPELFAPAPVPTTTLQSDHALAGGPL